MDVSPRNPWLTADGAGSVRTVADGLARASAAMRAGCTPANLLVGGVLILGWSALVGWTGPGWERWQSRSCVSLALQPASCTPARSVKDQGRIAPAADAGRVSP